MATRPSAPSWLPVSCPTKLNRNQSSPVRRGLFLEIPPMFHEYPKCLYLGGDAEEVYCVVLDPIDEKQARSDGYLSAGESQEKAKRKAKDE